jgi:starch phosphorylase
MTDVVQNSATTNEHSRTGLSADALRRGVVDHLRYSVGRPAAALKPEHYYRALALAVRDRMQDNRVASTQTSLDLGRKVTCYLSAEFLMGPQLGSNLLNLGIEGPAREALACEEEPGLGNGGPSPTLITSSSGAATPSTTPTTRATTVRDGSPDGC